MCDVLILEDDPLLRMLFADALSGEGFIVREAGSAAEAWAVLRQPARVRVLLADEDLSACLASRTASSWRTRPCSSIRRWS